MNARMDMHQRLWFLLVLGCAQHELAVEACTRILFNRKGFPALSARTMDWMYPFNDTLQVNPRGQVMDGGAGEGYSKIWTSKYGSIVAAISEWLSPQTSSFTHAKFDYYRDGATDGLNEAGLAAHILYLKATQYPQLEREPVGVTYFRWVRYVLDNFATVSEAVAGMRDIRVAGVKAISSQNPEGLLGIHMAIEDKTGDSAIFEIDQGRMHIYHGRSQNYSVMTNDPIFPLQLDNLQRYLPYGGKYPLPGNTDPRDRFVRMRYYLDHVTRSDDSTVMAGNLRSVIMQAAVPQGAPNDETDGATKDPTWWVSLTDLSQGIYYFSWTLNPFMIWVNLATLEKEGWFNEGRPYALLNPRQESLVGDVTELFQTGSGATINEALAAVSNGCLLVPLALLGLALVAALSGARLALLRDKPRTSRLSHGAEGSLDACRESLL